MRERVRSTQRESESIKNENTKMADKQATQYHTLGTAIIEESEAEEF